MKSLQFLLLLAPALTPCVAGPAESAILAAMKLSEQANYTWTSTITDDASTYEVQGKAAVAEGWTWMRMPVVKSIAQRLGREADTHVEAYFHGPAAFVIRTGDGWRTLDELPKRHRDWRDEDDWWVVPVTNTGFAAMTTPDLPADDPFGRRGLANDPADPFATGRFPRLLLIPAAPRDDEDARPFSNAQFALSQPHEDLAVIVSSCTEARFDRDTVCGTLSDSGAQLLLVRDGQHHLNPVAAAGVFKLHHKGGLVSKYELRLEGVLLVDKKRVHVRQSSTTAITDVGRTKLEVPAEVHDKLGP